MIKTAQQYHDHTSYQRDKMSPHSLDWQNQPVVFKDYHSLTPVLLPSDFSLPGEKLSTLLKERSWKDTSGEIHVRDLSPIFRLAYTLTAQTRHGGSVYYFRSVASAGALYPTEIYVATHAVKGLDDGLYHFAIHRHCLYPIRSQDLSPYLYQVIPISENRTPTLTFIFTAIFFRSAWKYRGRSYRYHLLDTGHLIENLILALTSLRLPFHLSYDFDDKKLNDLLGLDETKEATLAVLQVPGEESLSISDEKKLKDLENLPERIKKASRVAAKEIHYPTVLEIHRAGTAIIPKGRSETKMFQNLGITPVTWEKNTSPPTSPEIMNFSEAVFSRRSQRNFVKDSLLKEHLSALVDALCDQEGLHWLISIGFLIGHVEGMKPGFYLLDPEKKSFGLVHDGHFITIMAHICLDQVWLANAAVHFLFFTNFDILDHAWGARGYRYAMMTAGRMGQRLYLMATAMGIGCCGIGAFYDREAAELLDLSKESRLLYLVAVGPTKSKK